MKYTVVESLLDLELGKMYVKDGSIYLLKEVGTELTFEKDNNGEVVIPLDRLTLEEYLDNVEANVEENLFYKLRRDGE